MSGGGRSKNRCENGGRVPSARRPHLPPRGGRRKSDGDGARQGRRRTGGKIGKLNRTSDGSQREVGANIWWPWVRFPLWDSEGSRETSSGRRAVPDRPRPAEQQERELRRAEASLLFLKRGEA
jgi:hypothetical protein